MSWKTVKLGEIIESFSVRAKNLKDYSNLDFCGVSNQDGITVSKYAAEDKIEEYKIIEKGCFAYNPYRINVGSIALLSEERKGLISPAYVIFKTKSESIIDELLLKFLKSYEGLRQIKLHARGTVRQALRFEDLCKIEISIPDLATQRKLFYKLEIQQKAGDTILSELSNQLELVRKLRQAFLREAMHGKLVPQYPTDEPASVLLEKIKAEKKRLIAEKKIKKQKPLPEIKPEEIPFEIPTNWTWSRYGDVVSIESNLVSPFDFPNHPHVAPDNIEKNTGKLLPVRTVLEDEVKSGNHLFFPGHLIYSKVRPKLNKVALVDFEGLCSADMYPIRPFIESSFLQLGMLSEYFLREVDKFDNRVKMPKINQNQLSQIPFPLPPLPEQKRIVEKLEKLMAYCDELEANIRESKQNAETLLQVALKEALEADN